MKKVITLIDIDELDLPYGSVLEIVEEREKTYFALHSSAGGSYHVEVKKEDVKEFNGHEIDNLLKKYLSSRKK